MLCKKSGFILLFGGTTTSPIVNSTMYFYSRWPIRDPSNQVFFFRRNLAVPMKWTCTTDSQHIWLTLKNFRSRWNRISKMQTFVDLTAYWRFSRYSVDLLLVLLEICFLLCKATPLFTLFFLNKNAFLKKRTRTDCATNVRLEINPWFHE